ncbi:Conserved_hypothetical protein [Hexamita inflata]|uniref:Uncharacterized protein n=1 Tax=Hexamita inflata TaxID=28002 RepID=A0AA86QUI6_9EUKA|nr:Conserved hypothetical protein [Hexamita inflata]
MLSSIIVFKQISISNFNTCHNNIQLNDNKYNYCQKTSKLNNIKVQDSIIFSQKSNSAHLFIYTNYTQQSQINTNVQNFNINIFSLFGLNMNDQQIEDSILNISLEFPVRVGALLCISCDISLLNSTFVFIASGHQISALVIETQGNIKLQLSFVQFRVISNFSSGIVNTVKSSLNISIIDCKMSGSNLEQSVESGYISSFVNASISLSIQNVLICFKDTQRFGKSSISIISTGTEIALCDLCGTNNVVYGLCADSLLLGELKDGVLQCVSPFDFVDGKCVCKNGYLLNETTCVNILNAISNMSNLANNSQLLQIQQDISNININMSNLDSNLVLNFSHLQNQINTNTSNLESFIKSNFSKADLNLLQNTTVLDQRIFINISNLNANAKLNISEMNKTANLLDYTILTLNQLITDKIKKLQSQQQILDYQQQWLDCLNNFGHKFINNLCVTYQCPINGQQYINGSCQCPSDTKFVNNECECLIPGQKLNQGVCQCFTSDALVVNNVCTCGVGAINSSNTCICPQNSVLANGVCKCTISGQFIQNGNCLCQIGYLIIDKQCTAINYIINSSEFVCTQQIYVISFDLSAVTNVIHNAGDFTNGYIFGSLFNVQNAFIDIEDKVYLSIKPLFQSQTSFNNIKIRIDTQVVSQGSIVSTQNQIQISFMSITSKYGSSITNSGDINILLPSSENTNINNLLINLTFIRSQGNITLINSISGVVHINGYQILGSYESSGTVTLLTYKLNQSNTIINNVNFIPILYNVGNLSSYLISNIDQNQINFNNISVMIGNSSYLPICNSIVSNGTNNYRFGGLINMITNTNISLKTLIFDSYLTQSTKQSLYNGLLFGEADKTNSINIEKICQFTQFEMTTTSFGCFGLVGTVQGNFSLQQCQLHIILTNGTLENVGVVGYLQSQAFAIFNAISDSFGKLGLLGYAYKSVSTFRNVLLNNSKIQSQYSTGGFVGQLWSATIQIENGTIQFSNISATKSGSAALVGNALGSSSISTTLLELKNISILSSTAVGYILGANQGQTTFKVQGKTTGANFINGVSQINCAAFTQNWPQQCV